VQPCTSCADTATSIVSPTVQPPRTSRLLSCDPRLSAVPALLPSKPPSCWEPIQARGRPSDQSAGKPSAELTPCEHVNECELRVAEHMGFGTGIAPPRAIFTLVPRGSAAAWERRWPQRLGICRRDCRHRDHVIVGPIATLAYGAAAMPSGLMARFRGAEMAVKCRLY
jgi:hypothetical protein